MNNVRTLYFDFHWQTSKHFAMDIIYTATRLNLLRCPLKCKADLGSVRPSPQVSLLSFPWAAGTALQGCVWKGITLLLSADLSRTLFYINYFSLQKSQAKPIFSSRSYLF